MPGIISTVTVKGMISEGALADVPTREEILASGGCLERKVGR